MGRKKRTPVSHFQENRLNPHEQKGPPEPERVHFISNYSSERGEMCTGSKSTAWPLKTSAISHGTIPLLLTYMSCVRYISHLGAPFAFGQVHVVRNNLASLQHRVSSLARRRSLKACSPLKALCLTSQVSRSHNKRAPKNTKADEKCFLISPPGPCDIEKKK